MTPEDSTTWLQVGELAAGFGGNELEPTGDLAGRSCCATFEDDSELTLRFASASELAYRSTGSLAEFLHEATVPYVATSLRSGILLVDFLPPGTPPRSVSLVIDFARGVGTAVFGRLPLATEARQSLYTRASLREELTPVVTRIERFALAGSPSRPDGWHAPTTDLVGRRMRYEYGPRDLYEHIYLNERYYTWMCLRGSEEGLADTDRCHYRRIDQDLYLFVWQEKIVPTLGVVLVDTAALRSTGKLFGYTGGDFSAVTNIQIGARATLVNITPRAP